MPSLPDTSYANFTDTLPSNPLLSSDDDTSHTQLRLFIFLGVIGGFFSVMIVTYLVVKIQRYKEEKSIRPTGLSPGGQSGSSTRGLISPSSARQFSSPATITARTSSTPAFQHCLSPDGVNSPHYPVAPAPSPSHTLPQPSSSVERDMYQIPFVPLPSEADRKTHLPASATQRLWTDSKLSPVRSCILTGSGLESRIVNEDGYVGQGQASGSSPDSSRALTSLPSSGSDIGLGYTFTKASTGSFSHPNTSKCPSSGDPSLTASNIPDKTSKPRKLSLSTVRLLASRKRHTLPLRFAPPEPVPPVPVRPRYI